LKRMGGAGSTNPKTGLPEYKSFFSKAWSFIKKAAPIVLPIALSFIPGVNVIAAGFIGSGLGSLIGGAKPKDALKSAIFGGLTAGIGAGISGAVSGTGFFQGVQNALPSAFGGVGPGAGTFFESGLSNLGAGAATGTPVPPGSMAADVAGPGGFASNINQGDPTGLSVTSSYTPRVSTPGYGFGIGTLVDKGVGIVQRNPMTSLAVAGGLGALAAGGMGGKEKAATPLTSRKTGSDLLAENPAMYGVNIRKYRPQYTTGMGLFSAAEGGLASNGNLAAKGGKVDGPGTGTSDSIPARLSDGEFVFTAKAVRGAGDGSRMKGAKKMYEMMNKFERMA
jgi:hypothetical protein